MDDPRVAYDEHQAEPTNQEPASDGSKPRGRWLIVGVVLLLLLMFSVSIMVDQSAKKGPQEAEFVARNADCLGCHQDKMPDFNRTTVHEPFAQKECTVCHTPHGSRVQVSLVQQSNLYTSRWRSLLEWLPLRWLLSLSGNTRQLAANMGTGTVTNSGGTQLGAAAGSTDSSVTVVDSEGGPSDLVAPENELCWTCHGDLAPKLSEAYQHVPFQAGRCTECHNPHASDSPTLLNGSPQQLCFTCHPMGLELNMAQVHPPAQQGNCTDCHDPHASKYRGILVARQRELCFRCHPTVAVLADKAVQHQPYLDDNCTGCHMPHGSDAQPLLVTEQPNLCYTCHPDIKTDFAQPSRHPVGLNLTCANCHDPHAADYRGLISAQNNEFCYQCHDSMRSRFEASLHTTNLCIRCHTPHGSPTAPMLVDPNPELCLGCHPSFEGSNKHPVRPIFFDMHAKKGLTCSSTCHDPHGTQYEHMLRNFPSKLDGLCLQCHNGVGKDF